MLLLLTIIVLCQCNTGNEYLPESAGGTDEVLVVMPKGHWEGQPGAVVRSIFERPLEGMPQRESRFRVAEIPQFPNTSHFALRVRRDNEPLHALCIGA